MTWIVFFLCRLIRMLRNRSRTDTTVRDFQMAVCNNFFFCLFFFGRFVCLFAWFAKMCHISSFNCLFFDLYCFIFWFLEELFGRFITYLFFWNISFIFPYTPHFVQDDINVKSAGFWQIKKIFLPMNKHGWIIIFSGQFNNSLRRIFFENKTDFAHRFEVNNSWI